MIAPQVLGFLIFGIYPIIWVFQFSFYNYAGGQKEFVNLDNYVRIFTADPKYWMSVVNTFIISFGKLMLEIPLALVLAVILASKLKGRNLFRIAYFMPSILSPAVIGLVFYFIFASYGGIVNSVLMQMGVFSQPVNFFGGKWIAMSVVGITSIWINFGINMIFFLAGLQSIPAELYECGSLDGANKVQQFFHITVPMLKPILQTILMLSIIGSLKMTDLVLVLTGGGPAGGTEVMMTYVFKYFFSWGEVSIPQYGYGSALGFVTAIIVAIMTVIYLTLTRKMSQVDS